MPTSVNANRRQSTTYATGGAPECVTGRHQPPVLAPWNPTTLEGDSPRKRHGNHHYSDVACWEAATRIRRAATPVGGCLVAAGTDNGGGYARIGVGGGYDLAHRIIYRLERGAIPDGMVVRHTCDNRRCVSPAHLVIGTQLDNVRDMVERGRCKRGAEHWAAKLTPESVREIRRRTDARENREALAAEFGVAVITIHRIALRQTWRHLP